NAFGWGTPTFDARRMVGLLQGLFATVNVPAHLREVNLRIAQTLEGAGNLGDGVIRLGIDAPIFEDEVAGVPVSAGLQLYALPPDGARLPGIALMPYADA